MTNRHFRSFSLSGPMRWFFVAASALLTTMDASADDKAVQRELDSLKGVWKAVQFGHRDGAFPKEELDRREVTWTFKDGGKAIFAAKEFGGKDAQYTYRIDPYKSPKVIDFTYVGPALQLKGSKQFGIYKIEGGKLTLCLTGGKATDKDRPQKFEIENKDRVFLEMERPNKK